MQLAVSQINDSPGQVLVNDYLKPKGISISEFSVLSGVNKNVLQKLMRGERMAHSTISRISLVTRTSPRYWYYLQTMWLFRRYLESHKKVKEIEPISLPWQKSSFESPGQILSREFIKPSGERCKSIERKYKIRYPSLRDIVAGRRAITSVLAGKLQAAFGASARYWLDLQACHDIRKIIRTNPVGYISVQKSIENFRNDVEQRKFTLENAKEKSVHPGRILQMQFMKPSGMSIIEWQKILFIQTRKLKLILSGRKGLSMKMIIKLSYALNTDVTYWIDLNNRYYSQLAEAQCRKILKKEMISHASVQHKPPALFEFLEKHFLRPMDLPRKQFLRHIGIKRGYGDDLTVRIPRINFELAIRLGQALGVAPQYFVFLQLEYLIHLQESQSHKMATA